MPTDLVREGQACVSRGDLDRGLALLREAEIRALDMGDAATCGLALAARAAAHVYRREADAATPLLERAFRILPPDDLPGRALAHHARGMVAWLGHDTNRARRDLESARALYRGAGDDRAEARLLAHLGMLAAFQGAYREAERLHARSLQRGDTGALAIENWCGIASVRLWQGDAGGAAEALRSARQADPAGDRHPLMAPKVDLAEATLRLAEGELEAARDLAVAALDGAEGLGDPRGAAAAQAVLARVAHAEDRGPLALHLADQAWSRCEEPDEPAYLTLYGLARVWADRGQEPRAADLLDRAIAIARRAGAMPLLAHLL